MTTQLHYRFIISAAICITLAGFVLPSRAAEEVVDPHWSGEYCTECHVAGKIPERRYGGDVDKLCNRCHRTDPPACTKVHPTNCVLPDVMKENIPDDWLLVDSVVTCLTCHAVRLQMNTDAVGKTENKYFLRSVRPGDISSFCFNCHLKDKFQRVNPHREDSSQGTANRPSCFLCHTEGLYSGFEVCFEASVKTKSPSLCTGCHGNLTKEHLVHGQLESDKVSAKKDALHKLEQEGIELPLADGRMHCATCHNPHPKGIIGRKDAAVGAEEKYFLRIPSVHNLCVVCHTNESVEEYMQRFKKKRNPSKS